MSWTSSPQRYGTVPIAIHWLSALAVLIMLASGLAIAYSSDPERTVVILRVHVVVGTCVLLLTLARIAWWLLVDRRPADAPGLPKWQAGIAHVVHYGLYIVILVMVSSGIALALLSGALPILFGGKAGPLPTLTSYPPFIVHNLGAWTIVGLLVLHVGAALYHQFWRRDRLIARMGIGRGA